MNYNFTFNPTHPALLQESPALLSVPGLHDRGYVFADGHLLTVVSRERGDAQQVPLMLQQGQTLQLVVESQGRVGYGADINDFKVRRKLKLRYYLLAFF